MYRLLVTELAHQDVENIVSYIIEHLVNPTAAGEFLEEVDLRFFYGAQDYINLI